MTDTVTGFVALLLFVGYVVWIAWAHCYNRARDHGYRLGQPAGYAAAQIEAKQKADTEPTN